MENHYIPYSKLQIQPWTKSISTKLFGGNNPIVAKEAYTVMIQSVNTGSFGAPVTFTIDLDTDGGQYPIGTYTFSLVQWI